MNYNWDLDILYHGFDDLKYHQDIKKLKEGIVRINKHSSNLNQDQVSYLEKYLKEEENLTMLTEDLYNYCSYRLSTNVNDTKALSNLNEIMLIMQDSVIASVNVKKYLKDVDIDCLASKSSLIKTYQYNLKQIKASSKHMLSDAEEILESKLQMVASSSWSELQSKLCGNLMVNVKGFDEAMPLSTVRSKAYDNIKEVRYNAYLAELEAYKQISQPIAMALNNIKREVNIMNELRGYEDALSKTLEQSNLQRASLNAMIEAIKEELPTFRKYFKLKAQALGHNNGLPFYELFAPMGSLTKTYSIDEAKELVLDVYKSFSDSLYALGKDAFENRWIDFLPKAGKEGGAYCSTLNNHQVCRVFTNFTGSLGDVQTLAHELGHAYHGKVCFDNAILNRDYPMELAETASIFCQTLMSKKLINDLDDNFEKLTVVENSLQEDSQCVVDILSRFLFENKVFNTPISTPLSDNDMCNLMLEAQDESYGDGLDPDYRHPYMWLCKGHYYSAGLSFYNYPYAFGLLYGKGLYKEYLKDPKSFVENYDEMLKATSMNSIEEVAQKMGIDITKKDFWIDSLKFIEEDIDLFEQLLYKTGLLNDK